MYREMRPGCWRETGAVPFPEQSNTGCSGDCSGKGGSHEEASRRTQRSSRRCRVRQKPSAGAGRLHWCRRVTVEVGVQGALGWAGATQADDPGRAASLTGAGARVPRRGGARGLRSVRFRVRDCLVVPGAGYRCVGGGTEHGGASAGESGEDGPVGRGQAGPGSRTRGG